MVAVSQPDPAGAADWLSITPAAWPPPVPGPPVLMVAIVPLRQNTAAGYLAVIEPGAVFWCEPQAAPGLLASSQAIIAPPGATARHEPPLTANGIPGIGAGTSNASR